MTKVKIMFAVIAIVAIVGSTLAFKAKAHNMCLYQKTTPTFCILVKSLAHCTSELPNGIQTITPTVNGECELTSVPTELCRKSYLGCEVN